MGELAGQPNYFVEKILKGLPNNEANFYPAICGNCGWKGMSSLCDGGGQIADTGDYDDVICPKCGRQTINEWAGLTLGDGGYYTQMDLHPKLHTIRHDPNGRWKPGMKIHPRINNRTKNSFQFAPTLECVSVQEIDIEYWIGLIKEGYGVRVHGGQCMVTIDEVLLSTSEVEQLALNDGFPSVEAFFQWFNEDFKGVLIHWTELRY